MDHIHAGIVEGFGRLGLAETFVKLRDNSAAREQLALATPAVDTLRAGLSQRKRV